MNFDIRTATPYDTMQIVAAAHEYYEESKTEQSLSFSANWVREQVKAAYRNPNHEIYLAFDGGQLVGGLWINVTHQIHTPDLVGKDCFHYVHPYYRSTGIAQALLVHAEGWFRLQGCKAMIMGAKSGIEHNVAANKFYHKNAMKLVGSDFSKLL